MKGRIRVTSFLACICVIIALVSGCNNHQTQPESTDSVRGTYFVTVKSETPLENVKVFVYENETQSELVFVGKTDKNGTVSFLGDDGYQYVAVLQDVPTGYITDAFYPLTEKNTEIVLELSALTDELMGQITFALGDQMLDFTVADGEGNNYHLKTLLSEKKAVVLNFWFLNCEPCKMEFPYVQQAYEQFSDRIALLAMNPVDGDNDKIANFAEERSLTFPMFACDARWQDMWKLTAYPTTVIIDRYGTICLIHKGMLTDSSQLVNALEYITAENFEQKIFETLDEIP